MCMDLYHIPHYYFEIGEVNIGEVVLVQLASLADMGVSLPRDKKTSVCCWSSMYDLLIYSSVGRWVCTVV